ncbi:S8 family peptidase [Patescibacteria group bacterium]|nr:S8 family peptidase [Patescibacteria group bacterium]MBU2008051.1 S8 family peptidase [Patescibacteria group bacterium]MBU2233745.1 S8 family peptidase [Patescibacteria group bacterium]
MLGLVLFVIQPNFSAAQTKDDGGRKIVVFKVGLNDAAKDEIVRWVGGAKLKNIGLIGAEVIQIPSRAATEKLKTHPDIVRVDEDVEVFALQYREGNFRAERITRSSQSLPWGIDQIDAELVWPGGNTANPVKVGIIDTGISNNHPDLTANVKGGVNTINPRKSWNDDNGHGSHVAGIVAALNNTIGVVGVGPAADLYAIKALNAAGSGYLSDVIEGIQWAMTNGMQVINMSLGTDSDIQSFHDAVAAAKGTGVVVVAAAGNSGGSVIYPAAYPEAIAVSATDKNNVIASWSNRGPEIDLAAPGVSIYSTYKGTGYATLSGTSMAAPHVAGSVALVLNTPVGGYDVNLNGKWDPDEVQKKLQDRALDLGKTGFDNLYGWGLVNAYKAVQP